MKLFFVGASAFVLALPALAKLQNTPCVEILPELYRRGLGLFQTGEPVPVTDYARYGIDALKLKPGTKVNLVGKGSTAAVIRIVPPSGKPKLLRQYVKTELTPTDEEAKEKYQRDLVHLKAFHEASKHDPTETIEVAKVKKANDGKLSMELDDFKGYPFDRVLLLLEAENPVKRDVLIKEFNRRAAVFVADLRAAGFIVEEARPDDRYPGLKFYQMKLAPNGDLLDVAMHSNVIYSPLSGRFQLVDPF